MSCVVSRLEMIKLDPRIPPTRNDAVAGQTQRIESKNQQRIDFVAKLTIEEVPVQSNPESPVIEMVLRGPLGPVVLANLEEVLATKVGDCG